MTAAQTPIVTFQDILDAIAQNPELKEEMRRHLQDEALRNLPQTVALLAQNLQELTAIVQAMVERQARTETDIAELKDGQARMEERQTRMEERQTKMEGDIAELKDGQTRMEERQTQMEGDIAELKDGQARMEERQTQMEERQTHMEGDIAELKDGQTRMEDRQTRMEDRQTRMEDRQTRMEDRQTRMEGTLNRLSGTDYERRIARSLRRNSQRYFGISSAQLVHSVILPNNNPLPDLLDQACDAGAITAEEASQAERVDLVIIGHDNDDGIRYAVIEASVNVDRSDVTRAQARSQIIARATGSDVVPAVAGDTIPDTVQQYAADQGVTAVVIPAE